MVGGGGNVVCSVLQLWMDQQYVFAGEQHLIKKANADMCVCVCVSQMQASGPFRIITRLIS